MRVAGKATEDVPKLGSELISHELILRWLDASGNGREERVMKIFAEVSKRRAAGHSQKL